MIAYAELGFLLQNLISDGKHVSDAKHILHRNNRIIPEAFSKKFENLTLKLRIEQSF